MAALSRETRAGWVNFAAEAFFFSSSHFIAVDSFVGTQTAAFAVSPHPSLLMQNVRLGGPKVAKYWSDQMIYVFNIELCIDFFAKPLCSLH